MDDKDDIVRRTLMVKTDLITLPLLGSTVGEEVKTIFQSV